MKSLLRDGTNILAIQVLNEKPESQDFLIAAELEQLSKSPGRYMLTPSPAKMNGTGVVGFVKNVKFGLDAGLFEKPTQVPLSCDTPGATIIYTTDGSLPTIDNGTKISPSAQMLPTSGMVAIDNTTILRAAAFKEFWQPSRISTRTFIFPSKVIRQASVQPGIQGWSDWGMDVRVVDNPQPGYEAESALYALPSISIVAPVEDIFGDNGIYTRSSSRGAAPGSVPHPSNSSSRMGAKAFRRKLVFRCTATQVVTTALRPRIQCVSSSRPSMVTPNFDISF